MKFSPADQMRFYAEFARYEQAAGGPDPHLTLAGYFTSGLPLQERVWRLGCYGAAYNVPTGIALWRNWPLARVLAEAPTLEPWIREHWAGLAFRRERRAVRTPAKLAAHLVAWAQFANAIDAATWWESEDYEAAWRDVTAIYGVGRYIAIKLLEGLRRFCSAPVAISDLRARGGRSPRETLALLYPIHAPALLGDDRPAHLATADLTAAWAREELAERYGVELTWYTLQATLCEYKQSVIGRSQYPGRAQDSELGHYHRLASYWDGELDAFLPARAALFPGWALGEQAGWAGRREELGPVLSEYAYTWTDSRYDYRRTAEAGAWAEPITWQVEA